MHPPPNVALRCTDTRSIDAHAARRTRAVATGRAAVGRLRAPRSKERDTLRDHAHAGDVGIALLTDQSRRAHRRVNNEAAARSAYAGDAAAPTCCVGQGVTGGARRTCSATDSRGIGAAGPGAQRRRPRATGRGSRRGQADACMLAHPVDAVIDGARVVVVAVSVRAARRRRRWGWRRAGQALTRPRRIVAALSLDHEVGARGTGRAWRNNHTFAAARHGGALRSCGGPRRLRRRRDRYTRTRAWGAHLALAGHDRHLRSIAYFARRTRERRERNGAWPTACRTGALWGGRRLGCGDNRDTFATPRGAHRALAGHDRHRRAVTYLASRTRERWERNGTGTSAGPRALRGGCRHRCGNHGDTLTCACCAHFALPHSNEAGRAKRTRWLGAHGSWRAQRHDARAAARSPGTLRGGCRRWRSRRSRRRRHALARPCGCQGALAQQTDNFWARAIRRALRRYHARATTRDAAALGGRGRK